MTSDLPKIQAKHSFICDMDGVIYQGNRLLPGAGKFMDWLNANHKKFLFLTNSSERSPRELREKLLRLGIDVPAEAFYTSALATASFLKTQRPDGSVYVIGDAGLITALHDAGFTSNDHDPDYVVVGETRSYSFEKIELAINLVLKGARLIGTNPDMTGPSESGIVPATRALIAPIAMATGKQPYFIGKPNPLIMRHALKKLSSVREETIIIGDRMDTDIIAGIESEIDTALVLSGVTTAEEIGNFPYRPNFVLKGVGEIAGGDA
jgi:NagD protein